MQTRHLWRASSILSVTLLLAVLLVLPGVTSAHPTDGTGTPVDGQTGICVTGQVINMDHVGLAGIQVSAAAPGQAGMGAQTDQSGSFKFNGLIPGAWTFRVTVPDSWQAITPAEFSLDLAYGHGGCYAVRFKLNPVGCVIVHKQDATGAPLADWKITLTGSVDPTGTTDAQGNVRFDGLAPGRYSVTEEVRYPWRAMDKAVQGIDVHASQATDDCTAVSFRNELQPLTCISGYAVNDQHNGLRGWNIYAEPAAGGGPTFATQSGNDGSFKIPNLTLGTWRVWEEVPNWWTPVTPASFNVTLAQPGEPCVQVRFKNRPPDLCAAGYKLDENGRPLEGWTVNAYPVSSPTKVMTATTDYRGYYRFTDLTQEEWVFQEVHQVGWTALTDTQFKVSVSGGKSCTQVPTFRNQSPHGCIEGFKRDDLQVGLPGWNITLAPVSGSGYSSRSTDGTGHFRFDDLPAGDYWVAEKMQTGWEPVTPPKLQVTVQPSDSNACTSADFVNRQVARDICIDGYKLDTHGNVGLPGFEVKATLLNSSTVLTSTTDGSGYFRFSNLAEGSYKLEVSEQPGWVPAGPSSATVNVAWPPKFSCASVKFYDRQATTGSSEPPPANSNGSSSSGSCRTRIVVHRGQTLAGIAAAYRSTVGGMMRANAIANPNRIYAGQKLCIP